MNADIEVPMTKLKHIIDHFGDEVIWNYIKRQSA